MKFNSGIEANNFYHGYFIPTMNILGGRHSVWVQHGTPFRHGNWQRIPATRSWYERDMQRYTMHPVIQDVIERRHYRPLDWHLLVLEFPHRSVTDFNRLAYTRDERSGMADRQVITTIGKYLQRHFVIPDHEIRDIVALHTSSGDMTIESTLDAILDAARKGPHSCMSADIQVTCADGVVRHPYEVYDPKLGWSVALRRYEGRIDGRALIYHDDGDGKRYFVRSYKRCVDGGYSYADEALEAWLKAQGIIKHSSWDGAVIAKYVVCDGYLAPYLDGDAEYVYPQDGKLLITDCSDDAYQAQETNGMTADCNSGEECEDCGTRHDEDDMYWVGRWEDRRVGSCCIDDYTCVYGRNGNRYYLDNNCVMEVDGVYYDEDYLSANDIIELADGNYSHIDNAVFVESCDAYYASDDDDICYAEDTSRYELREDCWRCEATSLWYTDDTDYVKVDGDKYHPDEAPEQTTDTTENN